MSSIDAGINTGLGEMNDHVTSKENQLLFNFDLTVYKETVDKILLSNPLCWNNL